MEIWVIANVMQTETAPSKNVEPELAIAPISLWPGQVERREGLVGASWLAGTRCFWLLQLHGLSESPFKAFDRLTI
jgi:hypothetical protein